MTVAANEFLPREVAHDPIAGLVPGGTYVLTAQAYVPAGSPSFRPVVLDTNIGGDLVTVRDQWAPVAFQFTAPETGTVTLGWITDGSVVDVTSVGYVDDVALRLVGPPAYFDGATATTADHDFRWLGAAGNSQSAAFPAEPPALLAGPEMQPSGQFMADWTVTPTTGGEVTAWVGLVSPDGSTVIDRVGPVTVTAQTVLHYQAAQTVTTAFRPALWIVGPGVDWSLTTWSQATLSPEECVAPYRRTYPQVTTIDGPTVTGQEVTWCGDRLLYVSWTWQAGSPYRYGVPKILIAGLTSSTQESFQQAGVVGTPMGAISASPYNCPARTALVSCAPDPCYVGFTAPPAGPVIPDPRRPSITTQTVRACSVYVPAELVPDTQGVFSFILANDASDKVGVRVRVYEDVPAGGTPSDLCDFAYEYLIDYIAPEAVFTIDGVTGTGRVLCDGADYPVDASTVVRGSFGGPVEDPLAHCAKSYYVIVQWLATYPWTCTNYYVSGQAQGELSLAVNVAAREG